MKEQLFIKNTFIPLSKALNPSINRSITDIKQPDKRKSDFSKTVTIPNSKIAAKVFGDIFELNVVDGSFNPLVKADCLYQSDGETIIDGYCKLKSISRIGEDDIEYNVVLFGSVANIFRAMGEKQLNDTTNLGTFESMSEILDRWNHKFTAELQQLSWATEVYDSDAAALIPFALGQGYVYPLADYGLTSDLDFFDIKHIPCCLYAKEYIDAIFKSNGFSYTSTFFDSTYFKSLVIPSDPSNYQLDSADIDNREFDADTPTVASSGTATTNDLPKVNYTTPEIIIFGNELNDIGANYDPLTGEWTNVYAGNYNLTGRVQIDATFTPDTAAAVVMTSEIDGRIELVVNGVVVNSQPFHIIYDDYPSPFTIGARSTNTSPTFPSTEHLQGLSYSAVTNPATASIIPRSGGTPNLYYVTFQNVDIPAAAVCSVRFKARYLGLNGNQAHMCEDVLGTGYPADATITFGSNSLIFNKVNNAYPYVGNTLQIIKLVPKEVKQREFFKSIINMFNLFVSPDPTNQRNLIIEPRDDYYTQNVFNLTDKIDLSQPIEIRPVGNLNASEYLYKYKDDVDYYNKKYLENWVRSYGDRKVQVESDFSKKQKKTELIFSPTPSVAPPQKNKVLPTIIGLDQNNQAITTKNNIRILYYGGLKDTVDTWRHFESTFFFDDYAQYPYMGHFDDPFNATEDLNFGLVKEVYYDDTIEPITVTNNNLYNKYHKKFIDEVTSRNSKIVEAWVYMTPNDFRVWDFRSQYFFENSYYRLQEIKGYNPTENSLTKCVFLQIREEDIFDPTPIVIENDGGFVPAGGSGGGVIDGEDAPVKTKSQHQDGNNYTGGKDKSVVGSNNIIAPDSYKISIQGDDNKIYSQSSYITLENSHNNTIEAGLTDVTLINTDGLTIDESNVTYIDGVKVNGAAISSPTAVEEINSSQDVETDVLTYEVDTSGGDVTVTFELAFITYTEGQVWNFKKMEKNNDLIIAVNGGTIDDQASQTIKKRYTSISVQYDGTNFIII